MLTKLLLLAGAGALGTLARFALVGAVQKWHGGDYPMGTLVVNIVGCLLFGLIWGWVQHHTSISEQTQIIVLVGFMGAFTTFSTFAMDARHMIDQARWSHAAIHVITHNVIGVVAVFIGIAVGRAL